MMADDNHRKRWERKKKLYERNGYTEYSPKNQKRRLLATKDGAEEGLDSKAIEELARTLFVR